MYKNNLLRKSIIFSDPVFNDNTKFKIPLIIPSNNLVNRENKSHNLDLYNTNISNNNFDLTDSSKKILNLFKNDTFKYNFVTILYSVYEYGTLLMRDIYKYLETNKGATFSDIKKVAEKYKLKSNDNINKLVLSSLPKYKVFNFIQIMQLTDDELLKLLKKEKKYILYCINNEFTEYFEKLYSSEIRTKEELTDLVEYDQEYNTLNGVYYLIKD